MGADGFHVKERQTEVLCRGCLQVIDPDTCGCGQNKKGHGNVFDEGHPFVPMGCNCLREGEPVPAEDPKTKLIEWPFPWPEPKSVYESNGPPLGREYDVVVAGVLFLVKPANKTSYHTGRRQYRVICQDCDDVLHNNTNGPPSYIRNHLEEAHGIKVRW